MTLLIIILASLGAYFTTRKYKGSVRLFYFICVALFYFFIIMFLYRLFVNL